MSQLQRVRLVVFDVDGVLTDGSYALSDDGVEAKRFHARDGLGIRVGRDAGLVIGVLTAKVSAATQRRVQEIGVDHFVEGCGQKRPGIDRLMHDAAVSPDQTAYLGDDLLDLPAMLRVGFPMAVSDAAEEVRSAAVYITQAAGGHGAAREAIEHILKAQNKWDAVVRRFCEGDC